MFFDGFAGDFSYLYEVIFLGMYFSKHNKGITYNTRWGGTLEVCGKGMVCKEDTSVEPLSSSRQEWAGRFSTIALTAGITEVGPGFLETFTSMSELEIHYSVRSIAETPELLALLKKRRVVVRGWYDSAGERFAVAHGLRFIHADLLVGWAHDEEHYTNTKLEIRFDSKGKPYRHYDDYCPGISAGNNGGGEYERELPEDFFKGETLASFASWLTRFSSDILKNKDLEYFLATANRRLGK